MVNDCTFAPGFDGFAVPQVHIRVTLYCAIADRVSSPPRIVIVQPSELL